MIEWQNGWFAFDRPDREDYYLGELRWEVEGNAGHPLHAKKMRIVGWRRGYDNFIVQLPEDGRFAYVLLIWRRDAVTELPYCERFDDETAVSRFVGHWRLPNAARPECGSRPMRYL